MEKRPPSRSVLGYLFNLPPGVACLAHLVVHGFHPAVLWTALAPLPLWVPPQCVPGDIAGRLSEGVPDPTPLAPSYLDVELLEVAFVTLHLSEP